MFSLLTTLFSLRNVRFGPLADILRSPHDVRFTPDNGHSSAHCALYLVIGGLKHEHALIFAAFSVLLQVFVPYHRYAPILKCLTLVLFFYVAVAFTIEIPWRQVLVGTIVPTISLNHDYLLLVVAVLGTTISPYLFFWQASQEVEEMQNERSRPRLPLKILTRGGGSELTRMTERWTRLKTAHRLAIGHDQHHHRHDGDGDDSVDDSGPDKQMNGIDGQESHRESDDRRGEDNRVEANRFRKLGLQGGKPSENFGDCIGGRSCKHRDRR
jgi:hypothetical protein